MIEARIVCIRPNAVAGLRAARDEGLQQPYQQAKAAGGAGVRARQRELWSRRSRHPRPTSEESLDSRQDCPGAYDEVSERDLDLVSFDWRIDESNVQKHDWFDLGLEID